MTTIESPPTKLSDAVHNVPDTPRRRIVYVAPDCTDSAVQKRAHGFVGLGHRLLTFSFRRARYNVAYQPDWPNIELGQTTERRLGARILMCLKAVWVIFAHRRQWREAHILYVRNLDLSVLTVIGQILTRCRAPLVYEVLDVHPALTQSGPPAAILRWLERRVLNRCELLVVSSPAFLSNYFRPVQRYRGETFLLENKWPHECVSGQPRRVPYELADHDSRWTIGWFGNIRCRKSLEILAELADVLPERVKIYLRGCVSLLGEQTLSDTIRGRTNMTYAGEYTAPEDFPSVYSHVHFNWCADFGDGANSQWLLPNRLYEGGYFGIPALAIAGHETGRIVRARRLGIAVEEPVVKHLRELLLTLSSAEYRRLRGEIEAQSVSHFVDTGAMEQLMRRATVVEAADRTTPQRAATLR